MNGSGETADVSKDDDKRILHLIKLKKVSKLTQVNTGKLEPQEDGTNSATHIAQIF